MTTWVNVSTIAEWSGNPVGISRVEHELATRLLALDDVHAFVIRRDRVVPVQWPSEPQMEHKSTDSSRPWLASASKDRALGAYGTRLALHINHLQHQSHKMRVARMGAAAVSLVVPDTPASRYRLGRVADSAMKRYLSWKAKGSKRLGPSDESEGWMTLQSEVAAKECASHPFRDGDLVLSMGLDWDNRSSVILTQLRQEVEFSWVNCVYDVLPWELPHCVGSDYLRDLLLGHFLRLAAYCDAVWCISEYSRDRFTALCEEVGVVPPRTKAILLASEIESPTEVGGNLGSGRPPRIAGPYVITVGTFEIRKNYVTLVAAMQILASQNLSDGSPKLVIVGRRGWLADDTRHRIKSDPRLRELVLHLEDVSDEELAELYRGASGFVSASEGEGFGLPVYEALAANLPCVVSDIPVYRELFPSLNKLSPYDTRAWAEAILSLSRGQIAAVKEAATRSWAEVFSEWLEFVDEVQPSSTGRRNGV